MSSEILAKMRSSPKVKAYSGLEAPWYSCPADVPTRVAQIVKQVASGDVRIDVEINRISVPVTDRTRALVAVATALSEAQIEPEDISLRRPTLDEVFLHLSGPTKADNSLEAIL